jgi:hypothetical protein
MLDIGLPSLLWWQLTKAQTRTKCMSRSLSKRWQTPTYRVLHRLSVLRDLDAHFMPLDHALFPDIPSDIRVHSGFAIEHKKTASQILAEVERLMNEYSSTNVILVRPYYLNSFAIRTPYLPFLVLCR